MQASEKPAHERNCLGLLAKLSDQSSLFRQKTMSGAAEAKYFPKFGKKGSGSNFLSKCFPMNPSTCARRRKRRRNSNRSSPKANWAVGSMGWHAEQLAARKEREMNH